MTDSKEISILMDTPSDHKKKIKNEFQALEAPKQKVPYREATEACYTWLVVPDQI